jgi:hypothetical protein
LSTLCDVTVVGAGPFGLSIAAYLRGLGVDCRIIGSPMESWKSKMPKGMLLKSAGFASNLSDPEQAFTLRQFCVEHGSPYDHLDLPVPLETFSAYGLAFQKRFVPDVENEELVSLIPVPEGFDLRMKSGLSFRTRKVVIATGLTYFRHIPELLSHLPRDKLSHAADHHDLQRFQGQRVAVPIGLTYGFASMEYKRDQRDGGFRFVEPTVGRTDGQVEISALCGINLCHVGYCDAAGQPCPPLKLDPTHVWRDEFRDFISARILGTSCFYPPSHRIHNAYWRWDDPGPALLESVRGAKGALRARLGGARHFGPSRGAGVAAS